MTAEARLEARRALQQWEYDRRRKYFYQRPRPPSGAGIGDGGGGDPDPDPVLVPAVLEWLSGSENMPQMRMSVPPEAMITGDPWEILFYSDVGLTTLVATASGVVTEEEAGSAIVGGTIDKLLPDGLIYARGRVIDKTDWSNTVSQTIEGVPGMTSASAFSIVEGNLVVGTLTATMPSGFAIGGIDGAFFETVGDQLRFLVAPDFEYPNSYLNTNTYQITITPIAASDSDVGAPQNVTVTVTNFFEPALGGDIADYAAWFVAL